MEFDDYEENKSLDNNANIKGRKENPDLDLHLPL